jgi:hypothetical protein
MKCETLNLDPMKTYLEMTLILLLCSMGATAQTMGNKPVRDAWKSEDIRTRMNSLRRPLDPEHMHGLSAEVKKYALQQPGLPKTHTGNQVKSVMELTQKLDSTIHETWDSAAGQLVVSWKAIHAYDAGGNKTSEIRYAWNDSASLWALAAKDEYTYDASGNNILFVLNLWNPNTSQWVIYYKEGYAYNAGGNVTLDSLYYWDEYEGQWFNWSKTEYTYGEGGNLSLYVDKYWDDNTSRWANNYKSEFTYDVDGSLKALIGYLPNENTGQWYFDYKEEYEYDGSEFKNLKKVNYYYWDSRTSQWIFFGWDDYTYDDNLHIALIMEYEYDAELDQSSNFAKLESTYDAFGNITTVLYYWNKAGSEWATDNKKTDYYSQHEITGVSSIPGRKISVYPNPASGYVIFDGLNDSGSATVELFDMEGKKVLEQKLPESRQISVSNLRKGLYLYRLYDRGIIYKGKIGVE